MIANIINNCKQVLEESTQLVKQQIATAMVVIKELDSCHEAIICQGEAIEQQVHSQAQEIKTAVDQTERKLTMEMRTAVQQKRTVILIQKQGAREELTQLQSSIEFVEQSTKVQSDQQTVTSKSKILECMKASISHVKKSNLK